MRYAVVPVTAARAGDRAEFYPDLATAADACEMYNRGDAVIEPPACPRDARSRWAVVELPA